MAETNSLKNISLWNKALAFIAVGLAALMIADQSFYWRVMEDYNFGFFVPLFVVYVIYDRWPKISSFLLGSARKAEDIPTKKTVFAALLDVLVALGLLVSLAAFALGGAIRAGQGPANLSSLLMCLGFACYLLGGAFMVSEKDVQGRPYSLKQRLGFTFIFTFPALAWIISGPMVEFFATDLSLLLQGVVAQVVYETFNLLGMPIVLEGNVLIMGKGQVGVADACTGIRSLTGCIFAGSFLAAVFLDRLWKKIMLLVLAMLLAFFTNLLRGLFLTAWAYNYGSEAIEGKVHDITGYAVLGLTTVFLLLLLPLFQLKLLPDDDEDEFDGDGHGELPGSDATGGSSAEGAAS